MKFAQLFLILAIASTVNAQEAADPVTERTSIISEWALTLLEIERCLPESDVCGIELYIQGPKEKHQLGANLTGPFFPLLKAKKIFACENNDVMETKGPELIDLNGNQTLLQPHPGYLRDCSLVGTGEEVLMHYSLVDTKPFNLIRIFSSNGEILLEKRMDSEGVVEFTLLGQSYQVLVPAPEWPG
ncbi:hypothetical protein [Shewanella cyperi]|uniref:hypothetical protein n=1 Tax=Shewanella cyperi TaxID=2814292 RepID=UPI001A9514B7|nr:hypothetical protein [Shewanella cyperi]QSX40563.1 hypothetical protein JYB84_16680 [Shewanella cyperi]